MHLIPYEPRPLSPLGVVELRWYRLKAYSIVYGDAPFDRERFDAGLRLAERELPAPAVAPGRPGVGFVIFHQGRTGPYLVLGWWDNENELPVRVFLEDPAGWRPAAGGESFCVWDLRVVWHEREAYVRMMLGGEADEAAYLAAVAEGYA
jgi:hypothetical protein